MKSKKWKNDNIFIFTYILSFLILFLGEFLSLSHELSSFKGVYDTSKLLIPTLWLLLFFQKNLISVKSIFLFITLLPLSIIYSVITKDSFFTNAVIFVLLARCIDVKYLYKLLFLATSLLLFFIVIRFFYEYNILNESEYVFDELNNIKRYTFNLYNPNLFSMKIFVWATLCILSRNKVSFYTGTFLILLIYMTFQFTNSRTSFYLMILMVVMIISNQYLNYMRYKLIRFIFNISILTFALFSILTMLYYYEFNTFLEPINQVLSHRIRFSAEAFGNFGIHLFPSNIRVLLDPENSSVIDNGYVYLLLSGGVVYFILFMLLSSYLMINLNKNRLYNEAIVLFISMLYLLSESHFINMSYNIALLLFCLFIYKEKLLTYIK